MTLLSSKVVHVPAGREIEADINEYGTMGNKLRAMFGAAAVEAGTPDDDEPETNVVDTLANIMHHVRYDEIGDFDQLVESARTHFQAEIGEDAPVKETTTGTTTGDRTPGTKVVAELVHTREVDGRTFTITELRWNDTDGRSFDVSVDDCDELLTPDESLDEFPTDDELRTLRSQAVGAAGAIREYMATEDVRVNGWTPEGVLAAIRSSFHVTATWNDDPAQHEPFLVCKRCDEKLCSVEEGDSFDTLLAVVADHHCER